MSKLRLRTSNRNRKPALHLPLVPVAVGKVKLVATDSAFLSVGFSHASYPRWQGAFLRGGGRLTRPQITITDICLQEPRVSTVVPVTIHRGLCTREKPTDRKALSVTTSSVRTVVWEGRAGNRSPYPDLARLTQFRYEIHQHGPFRLDFLPIATSTYGVTYRTAHHRRAMSVFELHGV